MARGILEEMQRRETLKEIRALAWSGKVLCIDPGKRTGWALITCGTIIQRGTIDARGVLPEADACVIEEPRVYANPGKWKGDPQDIVRLGILAGEYAMRYPLSYTAGLDEWRKSIPDAVLLKRITRSLKPGVEFLGASVHSRDAQGIALWLLNRLK